MNFAALLKKKFVIMDGAQGTEIQKLKKEPYEIPELLNFTDPALIKSILRGYINSGSDIVCANTFGANKFKLEKYGKTVSEVIKEALYIANDAVKGTDVLVALDISTLGQLLEPAGSLTFDAAYEAYKEIMTAGEKYGADLILLETMTDLYEMKAGLLACKENTCLPIICSMTFEKNGRTFTGCSASAMAYTLGGLGADALGINCSLGPSDLQATLGELMSSTDLPVMLKPNAGLPDPITNKFSLSSDDFAAQMRKYADVMGVKFLGGCCGTSPEYIEKLCKSLKDVTPNRERFNHMSAVCTPTTVVYADKPKIIGERINPTGKKLFKDALKNNDMNYIMAQAIEQVNAGADILDVNVGLPQIDEKETMVKVVKAIQSVVSVPLQIDSTKPDVIEAALRAYNGKAIINSVNGEDEVLRSILPIVKKYGAAVVGLTLDQNGIPKTATERFEIARKILKSATEIGIPKEDVYIDCLTLTASAEQSAFTQTLDALMMVKSKLGLKTVLGISNISFGLPKRELVNSTFLTMALTCGLDFPIINPNDENMSGAVRAHRLLTNKDPHAAEYISYYSDLDKNENKIAFESNYNSKITLEEAVASGLKDDAARITEELLKTEAPADIIANRLIPALDKIGIRFENGKLFLPQLILSAEVAGTSFDIIKRSIADSGEIQQSKGKIVIATVKGDIHDIGKNIVKVMLENYGYDIIDLGKDVPEKSVADAVKEHGAKLCGLSALMTTTLPAMSETVMCVKKVMPDCKIMVGGAVVNAEFAEKIGADYYASDAKGAVDIAKMVFNQL